MEAGPSEVRQKRHRRRRQRRQSEEVVVNINDLGNELVSSSSPPQIPAPAGNAEVTRSNLNTESQLPAEVPGSFFHSSSDVKVSGGNFTSSQHQQNNFIINITPPRAQRLGQNFDRFPVLYHGTFPPPTEGQESDRMPTDGRASMRDRIPRQTQTHFSLNIPSSRPTQKNPDLYYSHLASKGRGSPLWIPEPSENLPIEYQRRGIGIGDVGILTDSGSFDFLFNICTPADDPINPEDMPEGFYPLSKPKPVDVNVHLEFKSHSYLASGLVETRQNNEDPSELVFESAASDGAVLTMPNGSRSRDLVRVASFRKYAYANAEKWYKYANEVRERGARNGDLRLVLGHNSSNTWGMATFANRATGENSSGEQRAFQLKFKPVKDSSTGGKYGWVCSGMAEVKSGPDRIEVDRLRIGGEGTEGNPSLGFENQCLFVRTMNITLQDDLWDKLSMEWAGLYSDDDSWSAPTQLQHTSSSPSHRSATSSGNAWGNSPAHGNTRGGGGSRDGASDIESLHDSDSPRPSTPQHNRNTVHLSSLPTLLNIHPSKAINEFLLRERPNVKMAITIDQDWISTFHEDEQGLPNPEIIWERLMTTHDICEGEDAVFLLPKSGTVNTALLHGLHHTTSHVSQTTPYIGKDGVINTDIFHWWDSDGIPESHKTTPSYTPSPTHKGSESELYSRKSDRPRPSRPISRMGLPQTPVRHSGRMPTQNLFSTPKTVPNSEQLDLNNESLNQTTSATVHDPAEGPLDPNVLQEFYDKLLDGTGL